ncbi:SRPBCC family protein [Pseudonocardia sp. GCM10023141]|uniref:SRPBCC family protein n=1 Tax=Pseudonocardia sp. GCM10023141 TaxID=3252653 RepID=UPI003612A06C
MSTAETLTVETPAAREIVLTREFAAPRALVYAAYTRPELLRRWFGPHGHQLVECEIDLVVGGNWRYVVQAPDASTMTIRGRFREIVEAERLVSIETNDDCEAETGTETLSTLTFDERDGRTTLTNTLIFATQEVRDMMLELGMQHGMGQGYERLDTTLAQVQA